MNVRVIVNDLNSGVQAFYAGGCRSRQLKTRRLFYSLRSRLLTASFWRKLSKLPLPLRKLMAQGITGVSPQTWNRLAGVLPGAMRAANVGDKPHKGANVLASGSVDALYLGLVSHCDDPAAVVIGGLEPPTLLTGNAPALTGLDDVQRMMALDMLTYLPDDILTKVDRAAIGVSLETRVPFLDHRVVEFAWSLPQSMKLRDWVEDLLSEARLQREGYFHLAPIRQKWAEHLSGQRNWAYHLWDVLMFQAWLEANPA